MKLQLCTPNLKYILYLIQHLLGEGSISYFYLVFPHSIYRHLTYTHLSLSGVPWPAGSVYVPSQSLLHTQWLSAIDSWSNSTLTPQMKRLHTVLLPEPPAIFTLSLSCILHLESQHTFHSLKWCIGACQNSSCLKEEVEMRLWCAVQLWPYTSNKQMHCPPITQASEADLHKGDEISKLVTVMSASIHSQSKNSDVCGNTPQCKENKIYSPHLIR